MKGAVTGVLRPKGAETVPWPMHAGCGGEGGGVGIVCGEVEVGGDDGEADGEADGDMCWRTSLRELCSGGGRRGRGWTTAYVKVADDAAWAIS